VSDVVSAETLFGDRAAFARRIIGISGMTDRALASGYVDLDAGETKAQIHNQPDGIGLVLRSRSTNQPATDFAEVPVSALTGYKGGSNIAWLLGTVQRYVLKGPAVALLIPSEVAELGSDSSEWRDVSRLLQHAKTLDDGTARDAAVQVGEPSSDGTPGTGLLPLPTMAEEVLAPTRYVEGATTRITVNAYERNPAARRDCIRLFGSACTVCGFDFGKVYGVLGEGYIHVHHVVPLSDVGREYVMDPANDLVPVCANCHAMLHRRSNVLSVEELKDCLAPRPQKGREKDPDEE